MSCSVTDNIYASGQWMINKVDESTMVSDILTSYVKCNPNLALLDIGNVIILRNHLMMDTVKIVSGGPSGHEPAYAGLVGKGLLTASIQGNIFQSPPPDLIFKTLKQLCRRNPHGVLVIISSRLSNRLAFGLAVEKIKAYDNVQIKIIIVNDEIKTTGEKQGLTGTILVQKIAGGMVEKGYFLDEIYNYCTSKLKDITTISVIIKNPVNLNVRIASSAKFLEDRQMEFGAGFHGEPGFLRMPLKSTKEIVEIMLNNLITIEENPENVKSVVVLLNNMGSSTKLEERIFLNEVIRQLEERQIKILRVYCLSVLTSLNTVGFSLTLMQVSELDVLEYLDCPTEAESWYGDNKVNEVILGEVPRLDTTFPKEELRTGSGTRKGPDVSSQVSEVLTTVVSHAAEVLTASERILNVMDSEAGDADTGTNLRLMTQQLLKYLTTENTDNPYAFLREMSDILEQRASGLCSLLYAVMFSSAATAFSRMPSDKLVDDTAWLQAFDCAIKAVERYGGCIALTNTLRAAQEAALVVLGGGSEDEEGGDTRRSLVKKSVDGAPVTEGEVLQLEKCSGAAEGAAKGGEEAAKRTVPPGKVHPDPGAQAVSLILRSIVASVQGLSSSSNTTRVQF